MNHKNRRMAVAIVLMASVYLAYTYGINLFLARSEACALSTIAEWTGTSPLPKTAYGIRVRSVGSAPTRELTVEFKAPREDVERWLRESPGTKGIQPVAKSDGSLCLKIKPRGGAKSAEIGLSGAGTKVRIRTSGSLVQ